MEYNKKNYEDKYNNIINCIGKQLLYIIMLNNINNLLILIDKALINLIKFKNLRGVMISINSSSL